MLTTKITELAKKSEVLVRNNASTILTALGASGTVVTAYLAAKASFKAASMIDEEERVTHKPVDTKTAVKHCWTLYIPAMVSGTGTIVCIIAAAKVDSRRKAALATAYSLSEKAFTEYKDKVTEILGEKKEQGIREKIAQDHVTNNPPGKDVVVLGTGQVLCCELYTGRYFHSDMETLRKAENEINAQLIRENSANLNDFYYLVGLPTTSYSGSIGWDVDKMLNLEFTTTLTEDGRPCLAFDYNYTKT